jgi:hypothetical protein
MNQDQIKAHAAGFLHSLATNPTLAAQYQGAPSDEERAQILGQHLGLAQAPSAGDLQAMAQYAGANLQDAVAQASLPADTVKMILSTQS